MDKYYVESDECVFCNVCAYCCPQEAFYDMGEYWAIDAGKCNGCGECERACPVCCIKSYYVFDPGQTPDIFDLNEFYLCAWAWMYTPWLNSGDSLYGVDCSHLVWRIFCEMGLYYGYATSSDIAASIYFSIISEGELQPGDILVWEGHHMAIYVEGEVPSGFDQTCDIYGTSETFGAVYCHSDWWREHYGPPVCLRYNP